MQKDNVSMLSMRLCTHFRAPERKVYVMEQIPNRTENSDNFFSVCHAQQRHIGLGLNP